MLNRIVFALLIVLVNSAVLCSADATTVVLASMRQLCDSLEIRGTLKLPLLPEDQHFVVLISNRVTIRDLMISDGNVTAVVRPDRSGSDSITIEIPTTLRRTSQLTFIFELSVPLQFANDVIVILDRGDRWYPVLPHGLTNAQLRVEVPIEFETFSTGNISHRTVDSTTNLSNFTTAIPVYKIPLLIARNDYYRSCSRAVDEHEISLNYYSIADSSAQVILAEAANAFEFYQDMLGNYHHKRLTILEVPGFEGTNIGTGILMIGTPTMQALAAGHYESLSLTIAAQWFGAGVFCDFPSKGFWFMSLSFSHYLRMLYEGRRLDSVALTAKINDNLSEYRKIAGNKTDTPIIDIVRPDSREKGIVIYSKGPWLFHQFALCVGTERMTMFSRELYSEFIGKVISIEQLIATMSTIDKDCANRLEAALGEVGL